MVHPIDGDGIDVARRSEDSGARFWKLSGSGKNEKVQRGEAQVRIFLLSISSRRIGFGCGESAHGIDLAFLARSFVTDFFMVVSNLYFLMKPSSPNQSLIEYPRFSIPCGVASNHDELKTTFSSPMEFPFGSSWLATFVIPSINSICLQIRKIAK